MLAKKRAIQKVKIEELLPGMIIAQDIYCTKTGSLLLRKGTAVNRSLIRLLNVHSQNIISVYRNIRMGADTYKNKKRSYNYFDEEDDVEKTKMKIISTRNLDEIEAKIVTDIYSIINEIYLYRKTKPFLKELKLIYLKIIEELSLSAMSRLYFAGKVNNQFLSHLIRTSVLSTYLCKLMNLDKTTTKNIAVASLLSNIGSTEIPPELFLKEEPFYNNGHKLIRLHPIYGYHYLVNDSKNIALSVLHHHERIDGSGYPYSLSSKDIHPWSKIIAIADVYTSLISAQGSYPAYSRYKAIELMFSQSQQFDKGLLTKFANNFLFYPIGTKVILNNGETGYIVDTSYSLPFRPTIKTDKDGRYIDLSKNLTLFIEQIIEE